MYLLPSDYVRSKAKLFWSQIKYGLENGFSDLDLAVDHAVDLLTQGDGINDPDLLELAGLQKSDALTIFELVCKKSEEESANEDARGIWLYLILDWVYLNKLDYEDPLGVVERIYADFDYPGIMSSFVRYMPPVDGYRPQDHTEEENRKRLYALWKDFLEREEARGAGVDPMK